MKKDKLVIWYSNSQDEYLINTASEIKSGNCQYVKGTDNILYIMESDQHKLAIKIKDRMNDVRKTVDY